MPPVKPKSAAAPPNRGKVALLLANLSPDAAGAVLAKFRPELHADLRADLERLRESPPPPGEADLVWAELEQFLDRVMPEGPAAAAPEPAGGAAAPGAPPAGQGGAPEATPVGEITDDGELLERLLGWDPDTLAEVLAQESPGVVAAVLKLFPPERAAALLQRLPVATGGLALGQAKAGVRADLIRSLVRPLLSRGERLARDPLRRLRLPGGGELEYVLDLLRGLHPNRRIQVLEEMEKYDPGTAAAAREKLYSVRDLLLLEESSIQAVLKEVSTETLVLTLLGADEEVKQKVMDNMSRRAREGLAEEMELAGSPSRGKMREAEQSLVQQVAVLAAVGKLNWVSD